MKWPSSTVFYDKGLIERLQALVGADFAHVTYTEAVALLEPHKGGVRVPGFLGL